ncbi:TonB-dependent receptor [Zhongshania aquimaris]|uniref:TonB-dependent receptor n=1 Tax=Zhongshania aquimaris TaxID=2857107 RepID=A0ABS6VN91_9GAMM|nr:TonB-dependent receptor [Zhongshania aquimaris]MBW2939518.1 TonB-dependent receptor [Zhongshania aquimaris]
MIKKTKSVGMSSGVNKTASAVGLCLAVSVGSSLSYGKNALEEVVVSARKMSADTQDVSTSISAFSGDALNSQGVADIKDLQNVTPGLIVTEMASYSLIFLRGIGSDSFQGPIDSSVATYMDGLYITYTSSQAQSLGVVESVNVLKGPQGTLYGRNAVGGAIVVETKKPSFQEPEVVLAAEGGNYNLLKGRAHVSGPVGDKFAFGLSGMYTNRETYLTYTPDPSQKHIDYDDRGYKVAARWAPSDWLEVNASHYKIRHSSADGVPLTNSDVSPAFEAVLTENDTPFETGVGTEVFTEMESVSSQISFDILSEYVNTKILFGHTEFFSNIFWDYDLSQEKVLIIEAVPNTADTDSLEIVFNSSEWGPDWFSWVGGIYVEDTFKDQRTPIYIDAVAVASGLVGTDLGALNDLVGALGLGAFGLSDTENINAVLYGGVQTDAFAAFAEFTFDITETISARIGGRYSDETREITESYVDARAQGLPLIGATDFIRVFDYPAEERSWDDFNPSAGVDWRYNDTSMLYYSYSTGFKSGNYNALNINAAPEAIEPEEAESHEIGLKADWFDGDLRTNFAVFSTTIENGHSQILSLASGGVTRLENASEYTVEGAEAEITYSGLVDGLRLTFAGTWLDGEYDEFECTGFDPETGLQRTFDCSGKDTIRTPDFSGTLDISYSFTISRFEAEIGAGAYYNSGFWFNPNNNVEEEEYTKTNARASLYDPETNLKLYAWGKNLNNEVSHLQKFRQDFGVGESYAAPRMYGVGIEYKY